LYKLDNIKGCLMCFAPCLTFCGFVREMRQMRHYVSTFWGTDHGSVYRVSF